MKYNCANIDNSLAVSQEVIQLRAGNKPVYQLYNECDFKLTYDMFTKLKMDSEKNRSKFNFVTMYRALASIKKSNYDIDDFETLTKSEVARLIELENHYNLEQIVIKDKKHIEDLRIDYTRFILTDFEISFIEKTILDKVFNYLDLEILLSKSIRQSLVTYVKSYCIQDTLGEAFCKLDESHISFPTIQQMPNSFITSASQYSYPILPNGLVLPFSNRLPTSNVAFQQIEVSNNDSSAHYYRKADWFYTLNNSVYESFLEKSIPKSDNLDRYLTFLRNTEFKIYASFLKKFGSNDRYEMLFLKIQLLKTLFLKNKEELINQVVSQLGEDFEELVNDNIIIYRDLDYFGNIIPLYYRVTEDSEIEYSLDLEKPSEFKATNYIVIKSMTSIKGFHTAIPLKNIEREGIDEILTNNYDYPIKRGIHDIRNPYLVSYPPYKNNFIKKGAITYDGFEYKNYLKRSTVMYIPDYVVIKKRGLASLEALDVDNFKVLPGRALAGLPAVAMSHILTPMNELDRIIYFRNKH